MKGSDVGEYTPRACSACGALMPGRHRDDCEWLRAHTTPAAMTAPTLTDAEIEDLLRFYQVKMLRELIVAQDYHIARLQAKLEPLRDEHRSVPRDG